MAEVAGTYNVRRLDRTATMVVTVKITREFRLRFWVAHQLMRLAAKVLNCGFRLEKAE